MVWDDHIILCGTHTHTQRPVHIALEYNNCCVFSELFVSINVANAPRYDYLAHFIIYPSSITIV